MTENKNYQQLTRTFQRLSRFSHLSAIAGWDMFAMMPPAAAPPAAKRWRSSACCSIRS
jgi:carboxypeptidase Taq